MSQVLVHSAAISVAVGLFFIAPPGVALVYLGVYAIVWAAADHLFPDC